MRDHHHNHGKAFPTINLKIGTVCGTGTRRIAHCTCNGDILNSEFKVPASGPIGLEGDRGQMEYRHIRMKTLK